MTNITTWIDVQKQLEDYLTIKLSHTQQKDGWLQKED